ncbi:MAG: hypothetical protein L6R39_007840, partial [Caloplaca ligustica]
IYEFDILAGCISSWSRRNPTSTFPADFRAIKDRAMGCVWDVSPKSERIWVHGSAWLWMFDLARDMPRPAGDEDDDDDVVGDGNEEGGKESEKHPKKRKRKRKRKGEKKISTTGRGAENGKRRKDEGDTGAGSKVPRRELTAGVGRSIRRTVGPKGMDAQIINLDREPDALDSDEEEADVDDDDDEEPSASSALVRLRRAGEDGREERDTAEDKGPPYWSTYKYRPILGIVPMGGDDDERGEGSGVEVAIVERPMFEVDLPGRYYGDQEWAERKDAGDILP